MITKEFRKAFKKHLGENYNYTPEVKKLLQMKNMTNRSGKEYSSQSIRNVFNGKRSNAGIEIALFQTYKIALEEKELLKSLEKSI